MSTNSTVSDPPWPLKGIRPIDRDSLRAQVHDSQPVKNFMIENFLGDEFADEIHASLPSFEETKQLGAISFTNVNEQNKYQLTDPSYSNRRS